MQPVVHIIGAGPVGLVMALRLAQSQSVTLFTLPAELKKYTACKVSVEVIPAPLLNLLLEFGVHPQHLGVDMLHRHRYIAWESNEPVYQDCPSTAYIERPQLELNLMQIVKAHPDIRIMPVSSIDMTGLLPKLRGLVFDATGRYAVTAQKRTIIRNGPVVRTWFQRHDLPADERVFRMAALPDGYVYRVASARIMVFGFVGRQNLLRLTPVQWSEYLEEAGAEWLQCPALPLDNWQKAKAGASGIQWAESQHDIQLLGDAAFARDALSSQGLALGISDALYAAAALENESQIKLWLEKRRSQFITHLAVLIGEISRCRFQDSLFWQSYLQKLQEIKAMYQHAESFRTIALSNGMLRVL